jgi:hypothetical protein
LRVVDAAVQRRQTQRRQKPARAVTALLKVTMLKPPQGDAAAAVAVVRGAAVFPTLWLALRPPHH